MGGYTSLLAFWIGGASSTAGVPAAEGPFHNRVHLVPWQDRTHVVPYEDRVVLVPRKVRVADAPDV